MFLYTLKKGIVKMEQEKIYQMKLHETELICGDTVIVMRVAGGWIYAFIESGRAVFVPFNNEFVKGF